MPSRKTTSSRKAEKRTPRGRPRLEDVAAIEKKLLTLAFDEFQKHGYGGASVNAIARAARVSKTTLYSRFPSKESLFRAIMHDQIQRVAEAGATLKDGRLRLAEGLKNYANYMIDLSFKGGLLQLNRLIYSESHRFPELGAAAAERSQVGIVQIADFIRRCAAADKIPCKDAESVAEVFIFMIRGWYVNVMLTNRKVAAAEREAWVERAIHVLIDSRRDW
jgi:AcrR family transcriptional regulator